MELTLIRHTTPKIDKGICYGSSDIEVADSFLKEANLVKKEFEHTKIDFAFSSPLIRCVKLAQVCGFQNPLLDHRVQEMDFGDWELKPWNEITGDYADMWMENYYKYPAPGGESYENLILRIKDFSSELYRDHSLNHIAIFTHSGPIRAFYHLLNNVPAEEVFKIDVPFGSFHAFSLKNNNEPFSEDRP